MSDRAQNPAPEGAGTAESELAERTVDDLRDIATAESVPGRSSMRKDDLVDAIVEARDHGSGGSPADGGPGDDGDLGAGPDGGQVRTGSETSRSLQYSQEVTSPDEDAERPGRSLATTHHEVIRQWAEDRGGVPATVEGTEHGDHLGVLRFDFGGDNDRLRQVSWDEWLRTFDARRLNFLYQEDHKDGSPSTFFRLESPDREDA